MIMSPGPWIGLPFSTFDILHFIVERK